MRYETESNAEAVRGGFAVVRQTLQSTRCYHAVIAKDRKVFYLCGCGKPVLGADGHSRLRRNANKDSRFAEGWRYRMKVRRRLDSGSAPK